ncbi:MAG: hypothetical protein CVV46_14870 [Spirochaetae bacterium HGW-Spirochaetae-2]|nr:MAG: hypothetical protein CVV46_14870 [Spirochaetae bacterium HGW-Spirochaetae-2]
MINRDHIHLSIRILEPKCQASFLLDILSIGKDLDRLVNLWTWMKTNPRPNIYLRQIDLPGIDTKFTETYKKILAEWLDATIPEEMIDRCYQGVVRFESRYGFQSKPELIRFRFLDPSLYWQGCSDIAVPSVQFCGLYSDWESIPVRRVFVVENDICALSFPPVEGAMVIFGRGYHFEHWKNCIWLQQVDLRYWGDLDTHGFRILDQFRMIFPHTTSFLMDRNTLMQHEISWGDEPKPTTAELVHLTPDEAVLYDDLRFNRIRRNLRLEQEFIRFGKIEEAVTFI